MFVLIVNYVKPLAEVDGFLAEHRAFLQRYYDSGNLLISGRQEPRVGGVIIANFATKAEVEAMIEQDPFYREKVAEYTILEFSPAMAAPFLAQFKAT